MHVAHAYASGMHVLCCGLPFAAHFLGLSLLTAAGVGAVHLWVHAHEWWLLAFSASVFLLGAGLEWRSRSRSRKKGPSWLLVLTGSCLVINFCVIATHQGGVNASPLAVPVSAGQAHGS